MQQGKVDQAERCYRLALSSDELRVRRSAAKNLGFLLLWRGDHKRVGTGMAVALKVNRSKRANGVVIHSTASRSPYGTTWAWVMPFSLCVTPCHCSNGRKGAFRCGSQPDCSVSRPSRLGTHGSGRPAQRGSPPRRPQIPLMSLIPLLDEILFGVAALQAHMASSPKQMMKRSRHVGLCWASNPQDRTMHAYKSCAPEQLIELQRRLLPHARRSAFKPMSEAHQAPKAATSTA